MRYLAERVPVPSKESTLELPNAEKSVSRIPTAPTSHPHPQFAKKEHASAGKVHFSLSLSPFAWQAALRALHSTTGDSSLRAQAAMPHCLRHSRKTPICTGFSLCTAISATNSKVLIPILLPAIPAEISCTAGAVKPGNASSTVL